MPCFTIPLHENDCHEPGGSPAGGQFCSDEAMGHVLNYLIKKHGPDWPAELVRIHKAGALRALGDTLLRDRRRRQSPPNPYVLH